MSGRIDSTSVNAAEKVTRDRVNAELCANMQSVWSGEFEYLFFNSFHYVYGVN